MVSSSGTRASDTALTVAPAGIATVRVPLANPSVAAVNEELTPFAPSDLAGGLTCLPLCLVNGPGSPVGRDLDTPTLLARYDVNVSLGHAPTVPASDEA